MNASIFPDDLKAPEFIPVFKKNIDLYKENYRLAIVFSQVAKVYSCIFRLKVS